jgi:exodeoxyribonuclease V alpha subunit
MGIASDQIQVLTPTRKGVVGTWSLNKLLQAGLNPAHPTKKERQMGEFSFREGDRVMQIRNNYDIMWRKCDGSAVGTGVFNGDVGVIKEIDPSMEQMTVVFDDREVDYDFDQLYELEPAFAITIHKSQGSEYPAVILPLLDGPRMLFTRNLLYTAVTRAAKCVVILGSKETVRKMIARGDEQKRYTDLLNRIKEVSEN